MDNDPATSMLGDIRRDVYQKNLRLNGTITERHDRSGAKIILCETYLCT